MTRVRVAALLIFSTALAVSVPSRAQSLPFGLFERYLDSLRQQAGIPGLSAAVIQDGRVTWDRSFGQRDIESVQPARFDTPYLIADLTQTLAATLLMQCVERGQADFDEPLGSWLPTVPDAGASLRQVLAHATRGPANWVYRYNPTRFAWIGPVIDACGQTPARVNLTQGILNRLGMTDTIPGRDITDSPAARQFYDEETLARYAAVLERAAVGYKVDRNKRAIRSDVRWPDLNASTGLISSVRDLAKFDAALDDYDLVGKDVLQAAWTNTVFDGSAMPTGLGWFTQIHEGERVVWHFGNAPDAFSSLIVKVPSRRITLILLANSDGLAAPYSLDQGDVTSSVFAQVFLRLFL